MSEKLHQLTGVYKSVLEVYRDRIIIRRRGIGNFFVHQGIKGDKTIYIDDISSVQLKLGGMTLGYLQFSIAGGNESIGGVTAAVSDENSFAFYAEKNEIATRIKNTIDRLKREQSRPAVFAPSKAPSASKTDELREYQKLMLEGVITAEEFEAKKKQILNI